MLDGVHHIAIAVRDLDSAVDAWRRMGVEVSYLEHGPKNVRVASFKVGEVIFELVSPYGPGTVETFLQENGNGVYHVAFQVSEINQKLAALEASGVALRDRQGREGIAWQVAWLEVAEKCGLPCQLIELDPNVSPERLAAAMGVAPSTAPTAGGAASGTHESAWAPRPIRPASMRPVTGFEPAIKAGPLVFISGQVATNSNGEVVGIGDIEAQCEQVYANLKAAVEAAGGTMGQIVRLVTYVTDRAYRVAAREARMRWFAGHPLPTSTLVVVSGLADPQYLLEIEATAIVP